MFQEFTGLQYLKIDIANNYGLDKDLWCDRIAWFDKNEAVLDSLVQTADEPALFYAGVKAYRDVLAKKPIGYMISLDATSSGLQLLAALTGDLTASKLCNVVDTGNREDAYTSIYQEMLTRINEEAKITRDDTKQAIMTSLYCSTAMPKQIFGEGALLDTFYDTMHDMAPAAWELKEAMLGLWNKTAYSHDWVLPDNFHVHVKVMSQVSEKVSFLNEPFDVTYNVNAPTEEGRSLGANMVHSIDGMIVREMTRRCDYNLDNINLLKEWINTKSFWNNHTSTENDNIVITLWNRYKETGYLSARILDHINPDNGGHVDMQVISDLVSSLPEKPFKVISIHDCFRCLPHYGNDLRKQYNNQLMLIAKSNLLGNIISQLLGHNVAIGKLHPNLYKHIPETNYALS